MKKLDKEQLEAVKSFFGISSDMMVTHLKEKGLLREEFEIGKWYKITEGASDIDWLLFYDGNTNYGFNSNRDWNSRFHTDIIKDNYVKKLATDKEVEEALIKEAKKRGFKDGDWTVKDIDYEYYNSEDSYYPNSLQLGVVVLFQEGEWLEIIKEKIETPLEVIINGETYIKK